MEEKIINNNDFKIFSKPKNTKNFSPFQKDNSLTKSKKLNEIQEKPYHRNIKKIPLSPFNQFQKNELSIDKDKNSSFDGKIKIKNKSKEKYFFKSISNEKIKLMGNGQLEMYREKTCREKNLANDNLTAYIKKRKNMNYGIGESITNINELGDRKTKLYENQRETFFKKYMSKIRGNGYTKISSWINLSSNCKRNSNVNLTTRDNSTSKEKIKNLIENINNGKNKYKKEKDIKNEIYVNKRKPKINYIYNKRILKFLMNIIY